jgi:hypothetical protein
LCDERTRLPACAGSTIADAARAWAEIGSIVAAHADDVTAHGLEYKLEQSAVAAGNKNKGLAGSKPSPSEHQL